MYDLFNILLVSVCQNFVKDFCIYVLQWYWPVVLFFCGIFVWFWYQGDGGSQNQFGSLPSSAIFWKSLSRICVSFSLNFWQNKYFYGRSLKSYFQPEYVPCTQTVYPTSNVIFTQIFIRHLKFVTSKAEVNLTPPQLSANQ